LRAEERHNGVHHFFGSTKQTGPRRKADIGRLQPIAEGEDKLLIPLLGLGFMLGIKHALEADHVAAVASLATQSSSLKNTVRVASAWGLGHTVVLVLLGSILSALDATLPEKVARAFEFAVGGMLIVLGIGVLRRLRSKRIHAHAHRHGAGAPHLHFHAHDEELSNHPARHGHDHTHGLLPRALLVGSVHGLAGSAALILIAVPTMHSAPRALAYLVVFGIGSILGMVLFSAVISLPLQFSARRLSRVSRGLEAALGLTNIVLGFWIAAHAGMF
jgi:cytochrome c biogenesis protein CcdA